MVRLDILSDPICPWCYIGRTLLGQALAERPDHPFEIHWQPFRLNPEMPPEGMDRRAYLEGKFGGPEGAAQAYAPVRARAAAAGLEIDFDAIPRTPDTTDAHRWTATYFPERGGRYQLDAQLLQHASDNNNPNSATPRTVANRTTAFLVEGADLELADPATNPAAMRQIARLTGGLYTDLHDADATAQMLDALPSAPRTTQRIERSAVWHSPVLFVAFLVLVSSEWFIRRWHRLV